MTIALRLTGLGWYIAGCIVLGIVGGWKLGELVGQEALLILTGAVLGSIIAFYGVYRMVLPAIYGSGRNRQLPAPNKPQDTDHGGTE